MATYSLLLNDRRPIELTYPNPAPMMSVPTSRTASEPIHNPLHLHRDAFAAAERVALDALAVYDGDGVEVTVLKHLSGGVTRTEGYVTARLESGPAHWGRATVEGHRRGFRSVPLAAILEQPDSGKRSYSFVCRIAQQVAELVAAGTPQDRAVRLVAAQRGCSPERVERLVNHGVAAAKFSADRSRRGEQPLIAIAW